MSSQCTLSSQHTNFYFRLFTFRCQHRNTKYVRSKNKVDCNHDARYNLSTTHSDFELAFAWYAVLFHKYIRNVYFSCIIFCCRYVPKLLSKTVTRSVVWTIFVAQYSDFKRQNISTIKWYNRPSIWAWTSTPVHIEYSHSVLIVYIWLHLNDWLVQDDSECLQIHFTAASIFSRLGTVPYIL